MLPSVLWMLVVKNYKKNYPTDSYTGKFSSAFGFLLIGPITELVPTLEITKSLMSLVNKH